MFSLRMLMAVVAVAALCVAGMMYRNEWWQAGILSLTYIIYAAAITAAIVSSERRVFWVAFAVFGVGYGVCMYFGMELLGPQRILDQIAGTLPHGFMVFGNQRVPAAPVGYEIFMQIGHVFSALATSFVAGTVAEWVVRRRNAVS